MYPNNNPINKIVDNVKSAVSSAVSNSGLGIEKAPQSVLMEAEAITGSNSRGYEDPIRAFAKIAAIASAITGKDFTAEDACYFFMAVKLQRETFSHKRDNLVDLAGYTNLLHKVVSRVEEKK